ncbi:MAG: hypothetical protein HW377_2467 [Actinobacteria bacterium]|nr:hypothetical protein [Actinomycetota bacterium]
MHSLDIDRASSLCLSPPPGKMAGIFGDGATGLVLRTLAGPLLRGARANSRPRDRQGQRFDRSERPNPIGSKVRRSLVGYFAINSGTDGDG